MTNDDLICDFCSSPGVLWDYPATDFQMPLHDGRSFVSTDGWVACAECSDFIEAGDDIGLFTHSILRLMALGDVDATGVNQIQTAFFAHRTGPRVFA